MEVLRELPNNLIVEQEVLANAMQNKTAAVKAIEGLNEGDFYNDLHRKIFNAIRTLFSLNKPIDILTVTETLETSENVDAETIKYIASIYANNEGLSSNQDTYIDILKEKSILRSLAEFSDEIKALSLEDKSPAKNVLEKAEKGLFEISQGGLRNSLTALDVIMSDTVQTIMKRVQNRGELSGVTTGFTDLNSLLGGFQKSDLVLLAARPSMGKTALAVNLAVNAAKAGKKVAMFSLEMSKTQIGQRILASFAQMNLSSLFKGELEGQDLVNLITASNELSKYSLHIDDTAAISLIELKAKLRRLKMEEGLDLVVIDYLQLMTTGERIENRVQEISQISRGLKAIAKELDVPVLALSQLSRALEQRPDKRPKLSDLRESGAIEQDADIVMFLYRDYVYNKETENPNLAEVIVSKHRNGPIGVVNLIWKDEYTRFFDVSNKAYEG
ncbi:MAG: replicative DNA helicase [Eubacteriales bacterium]|uniref:replicative DNA helicase n=1 Tax=Fenollaria sp. TaxID=1965292 RepID=UPI002A758ED3|nr:replicative DNA helicase [Fenollaria sp.]MDD7339834.1 replicative DNA helicase [Eubacteriales bacterium]MDY3106062.1 replicative DNA helicase [Fenollaria sp.]